MLRARGIVDFIVDLAQKKMKPLLATLVCVMLITSAFAQTRDEIVVKRAKEFHGAMASDDREAWRKFMMDNYTKSLLDRPVRAQVSNDGGAPGATPENQKTDPIESKLAMFQRMHDDFGKSTITSITPTGDAVEMVVSSASLSGTFKLRIDNTAPYLIDGIAVEVGDR